MRFSFGRIFLMVASLLAFGIIANAQTSQRYQGNIPFDFQVNGKSYAAGEFTVASVGTNTRHGWLELVEKKTGKTQIIGMGIPGDDNGQNTGKLVFVKDGDRYALAQVVIPEAQLKLKPSTENMMAQKRSSGDIVEVAFK
jgi:hypothetical protein